MTLHINDIKKAFEKCEYPFYKDLKIDRNVAECTLYSVRSKYRTTITLELSSYEKVIHQLSIELIKLRSHEYIENETTIAQVETIKIDLD